jgi:hypothetical protein
MKESFVFIVISHGGFEFNGAARVTMKKGAAG